MYAMFVVILPKYILPFSVTVYAWQEKETILNYYVQFTKKYIYEVYCNSINS